MGSVLFGHGQRDSIGLLAVGEFNFVWILHICL
jgi:hypothetical protein